MKTDSLFWDTSAVVPLCCHQGPSSAVRRLLKEHRRMVVWWGTPVEACSALARLRREGALDDATHEQALGRLQVLRRAWSEVQPVEPVRAMAEDLLVRCALRAADALQLAAALVACSEKPRRRSLVCLDDKLSIAARQVGFTVVPRI